MKRADEEGKKCIVDARAERGDGREALYRRCGIVDVGESVLDLGGRDDGMRGIAEVETERNV